MLSLVDKNSLRVWTKSIQPSGNVFDLFYFKNFLSSFSQQGQVWAGFNSIQNEPSLDWSYALQTGIKLAFPKVTDLGLKFYIATEFNSGSYGISEPQGDCEISLNEITGVFIPGLAFDNRGTRLGRGKAYYDKSLVNYSGLKVGVTWSNYFINGLIPRDSWDISMNYVLTENFLYQPMVEKQNG